MTRQRRALLDAIGKDMTHPTADEVHRLVRRRLPRISLGTVYRNLDALAAAAARGIRVRLVLDRHKYEESRSTQELLRGSVIPFRLAFGRNGPGSKMHHKFAIVDSQLLLTGSYNWTLESEEQNFENLIVLRVRECIELYTQEFEALWTEAAPLE